MVFYCLDKSTKLIGRPVKYRVDCHAEAYCFRVSNPYPKAKNSHDMVNKMIMKKPVCK